VKISWFEFGGSRFKDREGLAEILGKGYYREGSAWGAVRLGWAVAVPCEEAFELLSKCLGGRVIAYSSAGWADVALRRAPKTVRSGNLEAQGSRMWFALAEGGFSLAADVLWARCESFALDESSKGGERRKKSGSAGRLRI
jgi:hypothetical protein